MGLWGWDAKWRGLATLTRQAGENAEVIDCFAERVGVSWVRTECHQQPGRTRISSSGGVHLHGTMGVLINRDEAPDGGNKGTGNHDLSTDDRDNGGRPLLLPVAAIATGWETCI